MIIIFNSFRELYILPATFATVGYSAIPVWFNL